MRRAALLLILFVGCSPKEPAAPQRGAKPAQEAKPAVSSEVGNAMPSYSATYLDGKPFDVASEKGNVVLINVWATWCGPCRFEIPELQTLHDKYRDRGFKVIGVSVDEAGTDAVKQFVAENKMTYPVVLDAEGRIANVLRTTVLPTSVIVGQNGQIVWRKIGAVMPNETASLDALVQQAVRQKS